MHSPATPIVHFRPGTRHDVEFEAHGTTCRGWLTLPDTPAKGRGVPMVVMGHGFGGTKDHALEPYAHRFNAAGYATLLFDYRTFGASDGLPRNDVHYRREVEDWHAAIAFARNCEGADPARIVLWGTSFAGGLVVIAAAEDPNVAAIVCQCPMMDGLSSSIEMNRYAGSLLMLRNGAHGLYDFARSMAAMPAHYVPICAPEGNVGAMSSADALSGHRRLAGDARNEVTARSLLRVSRCRPVLSADRVQCPALVQICEQDTVAPPQAAEKAAAKIGQSVVVRYPLGHFDIYVDEGFESSVQDQLAFLLEHVSTSS